MGSGTGKILVNYLANPLLAKYTLDYLGGSIGWRLTRSQNMGGIIAQYDSGPKNVFTQTWTVVDPNAIEVKIKDNMTFTLNSSFVFQTINEIVENKLN